MGGSKKVTVGYKYHLGMHMVLCHGPIDNLSQIRVDNKIAFSTPVSGQSTFLVDKPELFGGESREGGVSGYVSFLDGAPTQGVNSYLVEQLGSLVPSFRGVASVVLHQCYLGMNPYIKRWGFRAMRIHTRQNGLLQWYNEKAEIGGGGLIEATDSWEWQQGASNLMTPPADPATFPVPSSGWNAAAPAPFGHQYTSTVYSPDIASPWAPRKPFWIRKTIVLDGTSTNLVLHTQAENSAFVYWDGVYIGAQNPTNVQGGNGSVDLNVPPELTTAGSHTIAVYALDEQRSNDNSDTYIYVTLTGNLDSGDMNPAHIIRECLTDPDWGMGYNEADIDDTAFIEAADQLYEENMGISLLWDRQIILQDFIQEVLKHINGVLYVDRTTGLFKLKIIRDNYDVEDLIHLTEDHIDKVENFNRPQFGELTTSVTVEYWDKSTGEKGSVTVQDIALEQMQQAAINTTLQYPGFTNKTLALRIAQQQLQTLSSQAASCTVYCDRTAAPLQVGDVFKMDWSDYGLSESVMRVVGMAYGDGRSNRIRMTVVEDAFALPTAPIITPGEPEWTDPSGAPLAAARKKAFEIPYLELVQRQGQTLTDELLTTNPDAGYVGAAASRPAAEINARLYTDPGSGYTDVGVLDFCPSATLVANIERTSEVFLVDSVKDLTLITPGTWAELNDEIMAVVSIVAAETAGQYTLTVKRACLDTVPVEHDQDDVILFWDELSGYDETEYVAGETVDVKLATVSGQGQLALADAPVDTVTLDSRAIRPYPPAKVQVNGLYFPVQVEGDLTLTWTHRDRTQQTGGTLVGFTEASIGPEAGTTYTIKVYNGLSLVRTVTGLTGTTWDYDSSMEATDGGPFEAVRFELYAVRDGYDSWQIHDFEITRPAPVTTLGIFSPEPQANRPIALLWNDGYFIACVVGKIGSDDTVGFYRIPDTGGTPEFVGVLYDGRYGIPDSYFHTVTRGFGSFLPVTAGGVDSFYNINWRRQPGGNDDDRWLLLVDGDTNEIKVIQTTSSLDEDIIAMARRDDGTAFALVAGTPPKMYKSTGGIVWSYVGNTTGIPYPLDGSGYLESLKMWVMDDDSLVIVGLFGSYRSTNDGVTWTAYEIEPLGGYSQGTLIDAAYDGTALAVIAEIVENNLYTEVVTADAPISWHRFGDGFGDGQFYNDTSRPGALGRFSPGVGISGAGVSQVAGFIGGADAGLIGSWGLACSVATYWEPRTTGNGAVNFFDGVDDFTAEMWISNFSPHAAPTLNITLFSQNRLIPAGGWYPEVQLDYEPSTGVIRFRTFGSIGSADLNISGNCGDLFDGDPHHIVITRGAGGRAHIYVDNVEIANRASGTVTSLTTGSLSAGTVWGNVFGANTTHFYSKIDECACYTRELSAADVEAHWEAAADSAARFNRIYRSTDRGVTWSKVRDVLKSSDLASSPGTFAVEWSRITPFDTGFAVYGHDDFSGVFPQVLLSDDHAATWGSITQVNTSDGTDNAAILQVVSNPSRIFATLTTRTVAGNRYPQFGYSTDAINFTNIDSSTFPAGATGADLRVTEDGEPHLYDENGLPKTSEG